jgi:hypothetical protein
MDRRRIVVLILIEARLTGKRLFHPFVSYISAIVSLSSLEGIKVGEQSLHGQSTDRKIKYSENRE